ncbi:MAG TPA: hypothetical protein DDY54_06110 [Deltaproteobacteria bacterium]|nr:hypothetical protein [Deltaproteobacteria bacterium]
MLQATRLMLGSPTRSFAQIPSVLQTEGAGAAKRLTICVWILQHTPELALRCAIDPAHHSLNKGVIHSNRRADVRLHGFLPGGNRAFATMGCPNPHIVQTEFRRDGQSSPEILHCPRIRETCSNTQPLAAPEIRVALLLLP